MKIYLVIGPPHMSHGLPIRLKVFRGSGKNESPASHFFWKLSKVVRFRTVLLFTLPRSRVTSLHPSVHGAGNVTQIEKNQFTTQFTTISCLHHLFGIAFFFMNYNLPYILPIFLYHLWCPFNSFLSFSMDFSWLHRSWRLSLGFFRRNARRRWRFLGLWPRVVVALPGPWRHRRILGGIGWDRIHEDQGSQLWTKNHCFRLCQFSSCPFCWRIWRCQHNLSFFGLESPWFEHEKPCILGGQKNVKPY